MASFSSAKEFAYFLLICSVSYSSDASIVDNMPQVVLRMWELAAGRNVIIQAVDLDLFFNRYDPLQPNLLNLYEEEFVGGDVSWTTDFVQQQMTVEFSRAYFRSVDVYFESNVQPYLNFEDMDNLVAICERHSGSGVLGYLNEAMFTSGFQEVIFRGVPFSLLFTRYNIHNPSGQVYEQLNRTEFFNIFYDIDINDDLLVVRSEMETFWLNGAYGSAATGGLLYDKLDYNDKSFIDVTAWDALLQELDCRDSDSKLDTEEVLQLDHILHDLRSYPNGACTTDRYQ